MTVRKRKLLKTVLIISKHVLGIYGLKIVMIIFSNSLKNVFPNIIELV